MELSREHSAPGPSVRATYRASRPEIQAQGLGPDTGSQTALPCPCRMSELRGEDRPGKAGHITGNAIGAKELPGFGGCHPNVYSQPRTLDKGPPQDVAGNQKHPCQYRNTSTHTSKCTDPHPVPDKTDTRDEWVETGHKGTNPDTPTQTPQTGTNQDTPDINTQTPTNTPTRQATDIRVCQWPGRGDSPCPCPFTLA